MIRTKLNAASFVFLVWVWVLVLSVATSARAQETGGVLSGTVTSSNGAPTDARVSLKSEATEQVRETETDSNGSYSISDLPAGDYEISVSAPGLNTATLQVTIVSGAEKTFDVALGSGFALSELGLSSSPGQGSAKDQALLDKRSHMLKLHRRLGLIAAAPMAASVITSFGAGGRSTSSTWRYVHMGLGAATSDLYFMSAYYAIRTPKIEGTVTRGQIRAHKILAWIHGPGMILTPILGGIAFSEKSKGERVHGIARAHGPVAIVTASAYAAAILSVSIKF